ncbi:MAG: hypothetical protein GF400_09485, partial [Candidatus Eisenbacteria bacterium]|nr:hypothetical protein [Candidatus Eisenbacteria bacterium]
MAQSVSSEAGFPSAGMAKPDRPEAGLPSAAMAQSVSSEAGFPSAGMAESLPPGATSVAARASETSDVVTLSKAGLLIVKQSRNLARPRKTCQGVASVLTPPGRPRILSSSAASRPAMGIEPGAGMRRKKDASAANRTAMAEGRKTTLWAVAAALSLVTAAASAGTHIDLAEADVPVLLGTGPGDRLGASLASGDLDADGALEVIIGAPGFEPAPELDDAGVVFVLDAELLQTLTAPARADTISPLSIEGGEPHERFGETLLVSDLDGDALQDLVVGAPSWGSGDALHSGRIYVFFGPLAATGSVPCTEGADAIVRGDRAGDRLGASLEAADLTGDGRPELIVAAPRA